MYLRAVSHASGFCQCAPVVRHLGQVRDLQRHAQTDLAQFGMIVSHVRHDLVTLLRGEVVVLEQVTLAEDLSNAQDLVARGVQGQVQKVTTALQGFKMVLQFL